MLMQVYLKIYLKKNDKEKPIKPHIEGDGYSDGEIVYDVWKCPNCDSAFELDYERHNYCPNCGQHIDWSEIKKC